VCKYIFYPAVGLTKISIALFVRRIADRASKPWRILADIFIGTVVAFIIASVFWNLFYATHHDLPGTRSTRDHWRRHQSA
jgi:hypothetical protein